MNKHLKLTAIATLLAFGSAGSPGTFAQGSGNQRIGIDDQRIANDDQRILHLLNRTTFGATADDLALVKRIGVNAYIQEQLNPRSIPQDPRINTLVDQSEALVTPPGELVAKFAREVMKQKARKDKGQATNDKSNKKEINKEINEAYREVREQILAAKIDRNLNSPRQLQEVMTDFWFNHFNISINKGSMDRFLVGSFEQQAIRPYALGNFRELLGATAHHPAMLFYLDNWQNTDPNSPGVRGKFKGINENYARELMELHTLGVDGGYTQQDVVALAHILTGLGIPNGAKLLRTGEPLNPAGWTFDSNRHDFSNKQLLGKTILGRGEAEIEEALDMLSMHPSTAHHLSYQLAQYFVADKPPESLVNKLSSTYLQSRGDIKAVMDTLLHSPEFWDAKYVSAKYKSPYRYAISVLRATGSRPNNFKRVTMFANMLGEPIYGCLTPDGYKNTQEAWLNPDGLLKRINFAKAVASGSVGEVPPDENARVSAVTACRLGPQSREAIAKASPMQRAALMLGSPEFMTY